MTDKQERIYGVSWLHLLAYSIVALCALLQVVDKVSDTSSEIQWSVSALSISVAFSGLAVIASLLMKEKFIGTAIEGGLAFLLLVFYSILMPYILNPLEGDVVALASPQLNGNLYFFAWFAMIASFVLWFQYLMAAYKVGGDEESRKNKNHSPLLWAGACFASFVVMVAAVRFYMTEPVCDVNNAECKRTKFALSLGTISAFFSMVHMAVGHMFPSMIDTVVSVVMLILWAFGVSYITFGAEAPGKELGNLYFGTWISFVLVLQASATGLRAMFLGDEDEDAEPAAAAGGEARSPDEEKGEKDVDKQDDTQTGEEIKA